MSGYECTYTPKNLSDCIELGTLLHEWGVALHVTGIMLESILDKLEFHITDIVVKYVMNHSSHIMYNEHLTESGVVRYTREQIETRMRSLEKPKMIIEQLNKPWQYVIDDVLGGSAMVIDDVPKFALVGAKKLASVVKESDDFMIELSIEAAARDMIKSVVSNHVVPAVKREIDNGIMCACLRAGSDAERILKQLLKRAMDVINVNKWLDELDFWRLYTETNQTK